MENNIYELFFNEYDIEEEYEEYNEYLNEMFLVLDACIFAYKNRENKEFTYIEFEKIYYHINSRLDETVNKYDFPFLKFITKMKLNKFQQFCLIIGMAVNYNPKYIKEFNNINIKDNEFVATKLTALILYQFIEPIEEEKYLKLLNDKMFKICFKYEDCFDEKDVILNSKLTTRNSLYYYIMDKNVKENRIFGISEKFYYYEKLGNILLYEETIKKISRAYKNKNRLIVIKGKYGSGRKYIIKNVAKKLDKNVIFIEYEDLKEQIKNYKSDYMYAIRLELILENSILAITNFENKDSEKLVKNLEKLEENYFVTIKNDNKIVKPKNMEIIYFELNIPTINEKIILWEYFLKSYKYSNKIKSEVLANKFTVNAGKIKDILATAKIKADTERKELLEKEDIIDAIYMNNTDELGEFAKKVPCIFTWDDLVVTKEIKNQLEQISNQIKYKNVVGEQWGMYKKKPYGRGVCALFYGSPGTGKTMAVQVLANELEMELYKIDLSRMMSKYIGETEKNITELFKKARNVNAILCFDEADAFFAKRVEVGDSNDINSNGQVAHLLQEMEEYDGVSILTTNLKRHLDDAFIRRIKFIIRFQFPDSDTRKKLWKSILPKELPIGETIAFDYFAEKFEISGSEIKETLVNAAFIAAATDKKLMNKHIIEALRLCYAKYEKTLSDSEFGYLI